ncbi:hypothetical protein LIER_22515 [Lithospermum erythrorhizon]|uniref:Integrase catalytic domain-containing protein n=1 Tax=Lithospermum erythrorhizon TaxID=34254 RepID=A0AAV3QU77_LITER
MLVDTGSSTDFLYLSAFDKLQLPRSIIEPMRTPLTEFTGHSGYPLGVATLWVTMGKHLTSTTFQVQFTMVDIPDLSYNGLIGRPILTAIKAIVSPIYLKLKFPIAAGIVKMNGDQKRACVCYQASVPPLNPGIANQESRCKWRDNSEVNTMVNNEEDNSPKEKESLKSAIPHQDVECVPFTGKDPTKTFRILEWVVYVDGASNRKGTGAGIRIQGPDQVKMDVLEEPEDWRTLIARYFATEQLSSDRLEAKKMQSRSYKFHIHIGGRCGFFWPTLLKDAMMYVNTCDAFQRLSTIPQKTAAILTPVVSPIPFAMWGIDLVGKLPKAKGGVEYVVVVVDYFSKWVEAAPLKKIKGETSYTSFGNT